MKHLLALFIIFTLCVSMQAETLTAWEFDGYDGDEGTVVAAVVHHQFLPTEITRGSGVSTYFAGNSFAASGFPGNTGDTNYFFNADDYFEFSVQPRSGRVYQITDVKLWTQLWFPYEPTNSWFWRLASDQDGYAADLAIWGQTATNRKQTIDLTGSSAFEDLTTATTFRIYAYNVCAGSQVALKSPTLAPEWDVVVEGNEGSASGYDDILVAWEFTGNAGNELSDTADIVNPRIQATDIVRGPGLTAAANPDSFSASSWNYLGDANDYIQFSVVPLSGYRYTITNVSCNGYVEYPYTSSAFKWGLRSDTDGYAADLHVWTQGVQQLRRDVSLAGNTAFEDVSETTTFRLYGADICSGSPIGLEGTNADLVIQGQAWADGVSDANLLAWDFAGLSGNETNIAATTVHTNLNVTETDRAVNATPSGTRTNCFRGFWGYEWYEDRYLEFPVSPIMGYEYSVTTLMFQTFLSYVNEPTNSVFWRVKSDRDNFVETLATWGQTATSRVQVVSLAGHPSFATLTTSTVFRLYSSVVCANTQGGLEGAADDMEINGQIWLNKFGDIDDDGMGNEWELNGTGSTTGAMVGANFDGDYLTDYEEWLALTNPGDSNEYFRLEDITVASPPSVTITSEVGRVYTLQYNDHLPTGEWVNVSGQVNIPGNGGLLNMPDTVTNDMRSYRVRVKLP